MPLPLMILESIEDLSTLSYLLQSSSAANIIFERYDCKVVEAVLFNFAPQLQRLLRTIILIRSDRLSIASEVSSSEALDIFIRARVWNDSAGAKPLTNVTVSSVAVRSIVKSAGRVQQVVTSFFDEFLDRVNSIKPLYLPDKSYDFRHYCDILSEKTYRANLPEGCRYDIIKCGLPSWIEEQRVYRALWRIQLYFDLAMITKPSPGATSQAWDLLHSLGPPGVWAKPRSRWKVGEQWEWELGEIDCVYGYLCEISNVTTMPLARRSHLSELPVNEPNTVTAPKSMPYHDHGLSNSSHRIVQLDRPSPGVSKIRAIQFAFGPPLQYSRFDPFRRLGFHIWDSERMAGLGLIKGPLSERHLRPVRNGRTEFDYYFRWNSLVAEEWKNDTGF